MKPIQTLKYISLTVFVLSAGCATSQPAMHGHLDPTLGAAVKANIAAHAVAPTAAQKANTFIPADPARTQLARERYRTDTVPDPERVNNTD